MHYEFEPSKLFVCLCVLESCCVFDHIYLNNVRYNHEVLSMFSIMASSLEIFFVRNSKRVVHNAVR